MRDPPFETAESALYAYKRFCYKHVRILSTIQVLPEEELGASQRKRH